MSIFSIISDVLKLSFPFKDLNQFFPLIFSPVKPIIFEKISFSSTAHGSGRTMSRTQAKKEVQGEQLLKDMQKKGIYVRSVSMSGLAEEAGVAYKDINEVVKTVELAGISKPVVGLRPIGNVKG